ncbi:Phosphoribosylformylglycinamidine synthase, PurS subunit [hydrothermal vent metagenome]|uniref:Phosphoribosylformylglycinamidine synthase, PurS subunit n=1 Tax=hydrothermal vent metagenome TaxID=652676 RepID=A0A3B1DUI9_9ZZZZ
MKAIIDIHLKNGVLDTAGKATQNTLEMLHFKSIKNVNIGKQIIINIDESDKKKGREEIDKMCKQLLVNDVIEDYSVEII